MRTFLQLLVVESDEDEVFLIEDALRKGADFDYKVVSIGDFDAARGAVLESQYDVIILGRIFGLEDSFEILSSKVEAPIVWVPPHSTKANSEVLSKHRVFEIAVKEEFQIFPQILTRCIHQSLERNQRRRHLLLEQEKHALVLECSKDGVWDWDLDTGTFYASDRFREILQIKEQEDPLQAWRNLILPRQGFNSGLQNLLSGASRFWETEQVTSTNPPIWVQIKASALVDEEGEPVRVAGTLTDVQEAHVAQERFQHAALHDELTGLPNRSYLQQEYLRRKAGGQRGAVLYLDLDWFKSFNDTLGHRVGDYILVEIAKRLTTVLQGRGFLARHGGDEFVVLFEGNEGHENISKQCLHVIREALDLHQGRYQISASAGLAYDCGDSRDLISDADLAMFEAKRRGRGQLVVFEGEIRTKAERQFKLDRGLRTALSKRSLSVVYQPIVSMATGNPVAFEALCRWKHPELGPISPAEFIPLAERTGLIGILGDFVFHRAVDDLLKHPLLAKHSSVSVNVSAEQLADEHFFARVLGFLFDIPSGSLGIEITESGILRNPERVQSLLKRLKEKKVYAHLDDFGTGYASLQHLVTLPLEGVKIDMSLTQDVISDSRIAAAIRATVGLSHSLGMYCVAEGVTSESQKKKLEALGVDFAQGYHIAKPMTASEAEAWVKRAVS